MMSELVVESGCRNINSIRNADDAALIADSEAKLKTFVQDVSEHSEAMEIKINRKKKNTGSYKKR